MYANAAPSVPVAPVSKPDPTTYISKNPAKADLSITLVTPINPNEPPDFGIVEEVIQ